MTLLSLIYLIAAIVLEVAGTTAMKFAQGFTKPLPSVLVVMCYVLSLGGLTLALKQMPVSVVYAIWSGLGTALIALIGFVWFKEPVTAVKVGSLVLIILGVVGLTLTGRGHE